MKNHYYLLILMLFMVVCTCEKKPERDIIMSENILYNSTNLVALDNFVHQALIELNVKNTIVYVDYLPPAMEEGDGYFINGCIYEDGLNVYQIYLYKNLTIGNALMTTAHELIHLKQINHAILIDCGRNNGMVYKNITYNEVVSYYSREWEKDAEEYSEYLVDLILIK